MRITTDFSGSVPWAGTWSRFSCIVLSLAAGIVSGCGQSDIKVYRVAKETQAQPAAARTAPAAADAVDELKYKTPAGWEEAPKGEMRAASFHVNGANGKKADVSA